MASTLFSQDKLDAIYRAAVEVLGQMGMKVRNRQCLEALERFGARVDFPNERALFSEAVIDRIMAIVKSDYAGWQPGRPTLPREIGIGGGGTCPFYFDEEQWSPRRATESDCIEACKIVETSPVAAKRTDCQIPPVMPPLHCGVSIAPTPSICLSDRMIGPTTPRVSTLVWPGLIISSTRNSNGVKPPSWKPTTSSFSQT